MARIRFAALLAAGSTLLTPSLLPAQSAAVRGVARVLEPVGAARLPRLARSGGAGWDRPAGGETLRLTTRIGAPVRLSLAGGATRHGLRLESAVGAGSFGVARHALTLPPMRAEHLVDVPAGPVVVVVTYF